MESPQTWVYRYVDTCERFGEYNSGVGKTILGAALLKNANFATFLHYIYRLSENKFKNNPFEFVKKTNGNHSFEQKDYRLWLAKELSENLCVMRKVSERGGQSRTPFQAEFSVLRQFDFIKKI